MGRKQDWLNRHPTVSELEDATTASGIPVEVVYTSDDVVPEPEDRNGMPGDPPFGRGVYPTMYRGRPWTIRMYSGMETPSETNTRFKFLLERGQTGLSVAFDLPTQMGYDADHQAARFEVGRTGVATSSIEDMAGVFDGIPLDRVSTSFTINATAPIILAMYIVTAERQGVEPAALRGTIQNDILKEFIARNTYIYPPTPSLRLLTDTMEYCAKHLPHFNSVSVSGYHMRQAGCDAIQEVAFTLSNALVYAQELVDRGIPIDRFAPRISFNLATMSDLFEEVAKHRATRRLWSRLVENRFSPQDQRSKMLRFFSGGDGLSLTAIEPLNNIVRVTMHQLGSILGGAQAMHSVAYDEAIRLPTEQSSLVALRTQQILAEEFGLTKTVDPLAGSYYVEYLTDEIESRASELLDEITDRGGIVSLIETGWVQGAIAQKAYEYERAIASGQLKVVGVNSYVSSEADDSRFEFPSEWDATYEKNQIERLKRHRARRNDNDIKRALKSIESAARTSKNLMSLILDAVRAGATVGEISDTLREVWGTHG